MDNPKCVYHIQSTVPISSLMAPLGNFVRAPFQDERLAAQRFLATLRGKVQLVQQQRFGALEALRQRDAGRSSWDPWDSGI